MDTELVLDITTAPKRNSKVWTPSTITWEDLLAWMETPADRKECGNYILGRLSAPHRSKTTIASRSAITLDLDTPGENCVSHLREVLSGVKAIVHTTYSSTPQAPRYRVIIPTSRDVYPDEYHAIVRSLISRIGEDEVDAGSVQPERYMFKPATQDADSYEWFAIEGEPLEVDEYLAEFEEDLSALPLPSISHRKRDPFTLDGVVGAFNRAYPFEDVIEVYDLPYEACGEGLWKLKGAKSEAGLRLVGEGLVFSHHVTDPAFNQACSAFDLARLHLHGDLDEGIAPATPVNRRPSQREMMETASKDPRVVAQLVGVDFDEAMDAEAESEKWKLTLQYSAKGKLLDVIDNWDKIRANDPVFGSMFFNEMSLSVEVDAPLPWRNIEETSGGATFTGVDRYALGEYIERSYGIRVSKAFLDGIVDTHAHKRRVNPVRRYLESLVWDGVPRLEECLPGVRPTEYTKLVARKALVAAVARMLRPGIKADHTLVIYGPEGLGKSYWISKMAQGFSTSLGKIGDKDTLITMRRSWIMVADEGYSLKKADADVQKEFLTRTEDVFRMPYDREAMVHKRHSVIWGTTNDDVFLRRQEGNRRFLIVHSERAVDFDALTDDYVAQVWAEAVHLFRSGERLFLTEEESALAAREREAFTEEDALAGILDEYLETPVPEHWADMTPEARKVWMLNAKNPDELTPVGTSRIVETCTAQLWVEALGRNPGEHKRTDLIEIANSLKSLDNWVPVGRRRVPGYGPQMIYRYVDPEMLDLI